MISIIAAMSKNNVIGKGNTIPWHITEDYQRTKKLTMGHPIIMGRKNFESISSFKSFKGSDGKKLDKPKTLPGRTNIILSSNSDLETGEGQLANNIESALEIANNSPGSEEIFIFGGASLYNEFIDKADKLYLTVLDHEIEGDIFFPEINDSIWKIEKSQKFVTRVLECEIRYEFRIYVKVV
ncbi:MAG: dihydrofolate reductase [Candidatus Dojkabacteria bacterium]|nr:dihydrofolate reductase [Candidatus Dojkabacteria bacterium]MDQ7020977.1 dihydrofolate reductase [Candidatus Dojkabacteria bacterium]